MMPHIAVPSCRPAAVGIWTLALKQALLALGKEKNHTSCGLQLLGRRFFLAQPNLRNLADTPYPQEAHALFCLWYE